MRAIHLALAACALLWPVAARAQDTPRWTGPAVHVTPSDTAIRFTPHATNLSVLFDGLELDGERQPGLEPLTRTATFSARLEEVNATRRVRFTQNIKANVDKDADARIVIVAILPDRTETIVYPYGQRVQDPFVSRTFRSTLRVRQGQPYTATILLRVDRRRPEAVSHVQIASVDVLASQ